MGEVKGTRYQLKIRNHSPRTTESRKQKSKRRGTKSSSVLRELHYENTRIRRGGSDEYPQTMFLCKIRKIISTPVNPSFIIQKWGLRGSKLYRHVFVMALFD